MDSNKRAYPIIFLNGGRFQVKHAAIVGLDGGTWAASDGFTVSVDEAQTLVSVR